MTTDVELITVHAILDLEGVPRVSSSNVYFSKSDLPDWDAWQPVLEVLAGNLARARPREDLIFWIHDIWNGETSLGMTRPPGSNRELLPLLRGTPVVSRGHGRGFLVIEPRPVLKWCANGPLIRLWPGPIPPAAPEQIGAVPVVNRRFRVKNPEDEADEVASAPGTVETMQIETIRIENVMRFEQFEASFSPSFTVIIGDNGAGKTNLLNLLRRVLAIWTPFAPRVLAGKDIVRETLHVENGTPYRKPHEPWRLEVHGRGPDGLPLEHTEHAEQNIVGNVRASRLHRAANTDVGVHLPVLAYFSPWREPPRKRKPRIKLPGAPRRLDGYVDALDLHADFTDFAGWFKGFEMQWALEGERVPAVEAVRETVIRCIPGCTSFRLIPKLDELVVTIKGTTHPIWRLSDGFRTMLALVGEIAWRSAVLNPALGADVARAVGGVVLIDELDLHLHPLWQRRVVEDLKSAFPRVQFIATTHSPFIIQSMGDHEVINLERAARLDFQRSSIEDIAEVEMGLTGVSRSRAFHEKVEAARRYLAALERRPENEAELRGLKAALDEIQERFGADPVYVASLMQKRAARGLA